MSSRCGSHSSQARRLAMISASGSAVVVVAVAAAVDGVQRQRQRQWQVQWERGGSEDWHDGQKWSAP